MKIDYQQQYNLLKNSIEDALRDRPLNSTIKKILKNALDGGCYHCINISFEKKNVTRCKRLGEELTDNWVQKKPEWCPYFQKN